MTGTLPKVFMSHTSSDKPFVARLAADLARIGVGVWYDSWEIRGGESIVEKINERLSANDHLVVVLSPASVRSSLKPGPRDGTGSRGTTDSLVRCQPRWGSERLAQESSADRN
jgi:hypothetical protein